jgi:hypothetical protein
MNAHIVPVELIANKCLLKNLLFSDTGQMNLVRLEVFMPSALQAALRAPQNIWP